LVDHLKEYKREVAANGDYDEARRAKLLYEDACSAHSRGEEAKSTRVSPRERYLEGRRAQEERWRREVEEFDAETEEKLEQLHKKHEFELHWQEEETLRQYHKPSSRLLQMWRMEKVLARSEEHDNAEVVRAESRELTKRETRMGQIATSTSGGSSCSKGSTQSWTSSSTPGSTGSTSYSVGKSAWAIKDSASIVKSRRIHRGSEPLLPGRTRAPAPKKTWPARALTLFEFPTRLPSMASPGETAKGKSEGAICPQEKEGGGRERNGDERRSGVNPSNISI
jgi:hypothetical protein